MKWHPKPYRNGEQCKFNKANNCAFNHKSKQKFENEIKGLQEERSNRQIMNLMKKILVMVQKLIVWKNMKMENIVMQKFCRIGWEYEILLW